MTTTWHGMIPEDGPERLVSQFRSLCRLCDERCAAGDELHAYWLESWDTRPQPTLRGMGQLVPLAPSHTYWGHPRCVAAAAPPFHAGRAWLLDATEAPPPPWDGRGPGRASLPGPLAPWDRAADRSPATVARHGGVCVLCPDEIRPGQDVVGVRVDEPDLPRVDTRWAHRICADAAEL